MKNPTGREIQYIGGLYAGWFSVRLITAVLLVSCFSFSAAGAQVSGEAALWNALRSGDHFILLRHALAPGMGDPPQFTLGECATQRNLSDEGRRQAEEIGNRFRVNGIDSARVFSSQWCRCLETAKLLSLAPVQELPVLNSFFLRYEDGAVQTAILKEWLAGQDLKQPLVLVTHQVNITALTNFYPGSGELVVVRRSDAGDLSVAGSIAPDQSVHQKGGKSASGYQLEKDS
ncbi:MAG: histidine phosphatase family protein [Desulforhopalus sp.]